MGHNSNVFFTCYKRKNPNINWNIIKLKLILIAGSWGSGTTAFIGALDSLGVSTLGPYFQSSDPRTTNTFELVSFRNLINCFVDEKTIKHKDNYNNDFIPALKKYKQEIENKINSNLHNNAEKVIALKMPLASICLPAICNVFDTKIIVVHRPFEEIEASRKRRNWPPLYGGLGAQHIYSRVFHDVLQHKLSFLGVSHHDFVSNTHETLMSIIKYCRIEYLQHNIKSAEAFIKKP